MIEIKFKSMIFLKEQNLVLIEGECFNEPVDISLSILQMAKVFGSDQKVGFFYGQGGGDYESLEGKCKETMKMILKYPLIEVWEREIECKKVLVEDDSWEHRSTDPEIIGIYAEDMGGWYNEGVHIKFPKNVYLEHINGRKIRVFLTPYSIRILVSQS